MNSFKIPIIPSTTQRSIRFPNDLIDDVENAIRRGYEKETNTRTR